jgi:hypothetical protein
MGKPYGIFTPLTIESWKSTEKGLFLLKIVIKIGYYSIVHRGAVVHS